jgi:hypothetical protein
MLIHCVYADLLVAVYVGVLYKSLPAALCVVIAHIIGDGVLFNYNKSSAMRMLDQVYHIVSILSVMSVFAQKGS